MPKSMWDAIREAKYLARAHPECLPMLCEFLAKLWPIPGQEYSVRVNTFNTFLQFEIDSPSIPPEPV